jgi:hypothetical protein
MVCVFDFLEFAKTVANTYIIKDIYGFEHDVRDIDLIITQSQFKLWNCYDNWAHYEACLRKSGIQWGISRVTPNKDKDFVRTNYQFSQVLNLSDDDISELCKPTTEWLKNISGNNIEQMELYLLGKLAKENSPQKIYENIQDNFENVKYSYKARKFDTYGFEAYLEFTISDNDEYEDFVKEYTMGLKGTSFPYDEEYIEYVLEDQFELVYSNDKVKDGMVYYDGEIFEDPFAISDADVRKIICCPEEQRIIFVAIGVFDGGGTDANFLCAYFNRFNINPREYSINRCD